MNRPLVFRRAMDLLGLTSPLFDFSGFVLYSEYAGLSSSDAVALRDMFDRAHEELNLAISSSEQSVFDSSCSAIVSTTGQDSDFVSTILDEVKYSTTLPPGSSDEIPLSFSSSGLKYSTAGCMKGEIAVSGCESPDRSIKVPEFVSGGYGRYRVTAVASNAFSDLKILRSVFLPDSIREIGYKAFSGCSSFDDFLIPASVRKIGFRAFEGCTSLSSIAVDPKNPFFKTYPRGILCLKKPFEVIRAPYSISGSVTIPEGVTKIGSESFEGCSGLTEVVLPDDVKNVMYRAFEGCSSLSSVCAPEGATIGFHAFPDGVTLELRHVEVSDSDIAEE